MRLRTFITSTALCVLMSDSSISATQDQRGERQPTTYGTTDDTAYVINAWDFQPRFLTGGVTANFAGSRYITAGSELVAPVNVPNGAVITGIELVGCDESVGYWMGAELVSSTVAAGTESYATHGGLNTGVVGTPGCDRFFAPLNVTADNSARSYMVSVYLGADFQTRFQAVRLYYKLQVSPAPGTATFGDVPVGHPYHRFVEALVAAGITGGCNPGNYCPDLPISRGQMAVFLSVALGLHWPN